MRLAPWGSRPTPLLPKWYRETFANEPVPEAVRTANPCIKTIGELEDFWENANSPVTSLVLQSLSRFFGPTSPPEDYVVVPEGIDHREISDYPLHVRTRNGLGRAGHLSGKEAITVGMFLRSPRLGRVSLIEFMCVSELAFENKTRGGRDDADVPTTGADTPSEDRQDEWITANDALVPLLAAARDFRGARTLADALRQDLPALASTLGSEGILDSVSIESLVGARGIADDVLGHLAPVTNLLKPSWRVVLKHRLLSSKPRTLDSIGRDLKLSRERVRQIQARLNATLGDAVASQIAVIARLLRGRLLPVMTSSELERSVAQTFSNGIEECLSSRIAHRMLLDALEYSCVDGICFNTEAMEVVTSLRTAAEQLADDVGLVNEKDLQSHLPGQDWQRFFGHLVAQARLHQVRGRTALRNTGKSRVKAVVLEIGRPATKEEIAERVGMTPAQVGAHLSVIPSIARADKDRWGLLEWIDDIYEGITAEIVQRINEDGGATRLERLLEELPRLFGVSEVSVRVYARTPYFVIHNGLVSVASEPKPSLRELDDVVDGHTKEGLPYWTVGVESRFFDGYSITRFPPELARELGCEPNGTISAGVDYPPGANAVSVSWPLASSNGASVGRISDALQRLEVKAGDRVRLVVTGPRRVEFRPSPAHKSRMERPSSDILERLKSRRQVF